MSTCPSCGGVLGVDCFNPGECAAITQDMVARAQQAEAEAPRWIAATERSPDHGVSVLCCAGRSMCVLEWRTELGRGGGFGERRRHGRGGWAIHHIENVTHWMPLPEWPK